MVYKIHSKMCYVPEARSITILADISLPQLQPSRAAYVAALRVADARWRCEMADQSGSAVGRGAVPCIVRFLLTLPARPHADATHTSTSHAPSRHYALQGVENPQTCGSCQVACASACRRLETAFATYVLPHAASLSVRDRARVPFAPAESNLCVGACTRRRGDVRGRGTRNISATTCEGLGAATRARGTERRR